MKTFDELFVHLQQRAQSGDENSVTVAALNAGVHTIGKKVVEEAAEAWMAAEHESKERTTAEIAQLLYWTQVLMLAKGISMSDVCEEL